MEEWIEKIEKLASMEKEHAIKLESESKALGDATIVGLVSSIAHDSNKHAGFYRAIASLLDKRALAIPESQADEFAVSLEKHIEVEKKMLETTKTLLNGSEDDRVKFLLSEILFDEERHHNMLSNLMKVIVERDVISDEDVWNMLWRDVESHGAPPDFDV